MRFTDHSNNVLTVQLLLLSACCIVLYVIRDTLRPLFYASVVSWFWRSFSTRLNPGGNKSVSNAKLHRDLQKSAAMVKAKIGCGQLLLGCDVLIAVHSRDQRREQA